jgi:DNA-binding Lrp family transcriptional regulator
MATAFVLPNILPEKGEKVVDVLRKMKHVREVYLLNGAYDAIVKLEAQDTRTLKETIIWDIRRVEEVTSTITLIVADSKV